MFRDEIAAQRMADLRREAAKQRLLRELRASRKHRRLGSELPGSGSWRSHRMRRRTATMATRAALWTGWLGFGLQVAGNQWDQRWRTAHGLQMEGARDLLDAHGLLYLGVAVMLLSALLLPARPLRRAAVGAKFLLAGAVAETLGYWLDGWQHFHGGESTLGHVLAFAGFVAALAGLAITTVARRPAIKRA